MDRRRRAARTVALMSLFTMADTQTDVPIASFVGDGSDLISLIVGIEPIQAGSGDPSPDNVRPISGWTGAKVTRAGKNLLRLVESEMISSGWNRSFPISVKAGTYIISCQNDFGASTALGAKVSLVDESNTVIKDLTNLYNFGQSSYHVGTVATITAEEASRIKRILFQCRANGTTYNDIAQGNLQLELGSTATAYHPYAGNTYTIQLGDTVYGGTLDVTQGKLTVDRKTVTFNGSEGWVASSTSQAQQGYYLPTNAMSKLRYYGNSIKCDKLKTFDNNSDQNYTAAEYGITGYYDYNSSFPNRNWIYVKAASIVSDTDGFKQWLANNPITVCYELATPIVYDLTPTQVTTLIGTNNIWADTGDIKYIEYNI